MKLFRKFRIARRPEIIGRTLTLELPELATGKITAKVDTGAYSGAIHTSRIVEKTLKSGKKVIEFNVLDSKKKITISSFHERRVKSSNGSTSVRYAIDTEVEIMGRKYPITITLADRKDMKFPMLIGRKFLRSHGFLVDVSKDKV